MSEEKTTKLQFRATDELWKQVLSYRIRSGMKNNNEAVEALIMQALKPEVDTSVITNEPIPDDTLREIRDFRTRIPIAENLTSSPLFISKDKKSGAYFTECHLKARELVKFTDQDATIDPELQEEYRANRVLEPGNPYFQKMVEDAISGRVFSDIVIEYSTGYREEVPLKILGGQHRDEAIKMALKEGADETHGLRVYFNLEKNQRAEIMRISNTNINVSPDLRDRIEEHRLEPSGMLRDFCHVTGMLKEGEDFGEKRKYEDFTPTLRMVRSFVVNFYKGVNYKGEIDKDAVVPYLCSSGGDTDEEYKGVFSRFKKGKTFDDTELLKAAKMFMKLHQKQFEVSDKMETASKKAFRVKAFSLAIISSWAFAAGVLQRYPERLKKLFDLPDFSGESDPLNAVAMSKAYHKSDSEAYRGLGTRDEAKERGRMLHLFLGYSDSAKSKITELMCSTAIDIYHSNDDKIKSDEKRKKAF